MMESATLISRLPWITRLLGVVVAPSTRREILPRRKTLRERDRERQRERERERGESIHVERREKREGER